MESNWLIVILVIIIVLIIIAIFIKRNQKDKKEFIQELIKDEEVSIPEEHDTEVDPKE